MRRLQLLVLIAGTLWFARSAHADSPPPGSAMAVLQKHCGRCHAGGKAEGELGFIDDRDRLIAAGYIVPGAAGRSELVRRLAEGEMPPAGVKLRPTAAEIETVRAWVEKLAQPAPPFQSWGDVDRLLAADTAKLRADVRPNVRYLSFAHLANTGATDAQLERYRTALATVLASLTWSPRAPTLVALDARKTVFRIDLRQLGWTTASWDTLRASYPYGVARGLVDGKQGPEAIRGDWFVATATRPPLYYALLGIPDTQAELARRLGVDLDEDIARGKVWRAGFNRSGVSVNNRVIERHATSFGALWRSYDFSSSVGRENIFQHPVDFQPAGGELIFNLPDGFQGYMLVDRTGRRIDRGPLAIVSDPRRPDRAVENAVSCMGCHASGIVPRTDQLRDAMAQMEAADRDRVRVLHPIADRMTQLYDQDRARFARALATVGARPVEPADEPINLLTLRYEGELTLATAAAELGLRPDELTARLPRLSSLRQTLAPLSTGGTIKRDTWAALFPRIVDGLAVAVPYTPVTGYDSPPAVWLDGNHRSWLFLDRASDQATALGICRGRGYELPRQAELIAAVTAGLGTSLQLSTPLWSAGTKLDASNLRYAAVIDPRSGVARRADVTERNGVVCVLR